ncbi:MAG: glutathione S-transferase N-terminal domain-containing protein [Thiotrichales bacterium]
MQLFISPTSPYVRKVRVTAHEKGLSDALTTTRCNAYADDPALLAANPLSRVPTLVTDDGEALYDSPVICEWLDRQRAEPCLIPVDGAPRWRVLRGQALADGVMDDAVATVLKLRRPETQCDATAIERHLAAVQRAIPAMERERAHWPGACSLAHIATACALTYLDFRLPNLDWRTHAPDLQVWYDDFVQRPAMVATRYEGASR